MLTANPTIQPLAAYDAGKERSEWPTRPRRPPLLCHCERQLAAKRA